MQIYEKLGVRPIVNAAGTLTRLGGALMRQEVVEAMFRAASDSVAMVELQAAASQVIAEATGAEAGYVTAGAAAALTLGTAACIARLDLAKMEALPSTERFPNEVVIAREHRNGYDHAIRAAGARLVEVGANEIWAGAGVRATEAWEFEAAINANTVAIAYFFRGGSSPSLEEVTQIGRKYDVPVLVDAAAQLPPTDNLRRFIAAGADLVTFSGGKGLRGPQNSGFLAGRKDLIASAALQNLDLDEHFRIWDPPERLIPKQVMQGIPRHGVGRGLKVSKETVVGLLTALQLFTPDFCIGERKRHIKVIEMILDALQDVRGLKATAQIPRDGQAIPLLSIAIDAGELEHDAFEISRRLKQGTPAVYLSEKLLSEGILIINPINLDDERAAIVVERLREITSR